MTSFRRFRSLNLATSVVIFALGVLFLGYFLFGRAGLVLGLFFSLTFVYFMLFHELLSFANWTAVKPWSGRDPWDLSSTLAFYSRKLQILTPEFGIFDNPIPLVFSEAQNQSEGIIGISTGALERLSPAELDALLALALVRLQYQQKVGPAILFRLAGILSFLAAKVDINLGLSTFRPMHRLLSLPIWLLQKIALSHSQMVQMDKKAAELLTHPRRLAEVLTRIHNTLYSRPAKLPYGTEHYLALKYSSPQYEWTDLHPPVEVRLKRMLGIEPV